jgi:ribonucleotide reductase alpha subunit
LADGTRRQAGSLTPGLALRKADMPVVVAGRPYPHAYTHGFYTGDGQRTGTTKGALLYGDKQDLVAHLDTDSTPRLLAGNRSWVSFPRLVEEKFDVPHWADVRGRVAWLAGLFDADGTVVRNPHSVGLQLSSANRAFLAEVQLLLTTLGVQAKVTQANSAGMRSLPDGNGGTKLYSCQVIWRLLVSACDVVRLQGLGFTPHRLVLGTNRPQRDARRFLRVVSVEDAGLASVVYCFEEPLRHQGTFEGVVTGQCLEQSLESYEMCCLVETFPANHDSLEDYKRTLKFAYLYAKTVTLGNTPWPRTNRVMTRNRRIGCSMSGIVQAIAKIGIEPFRQWCDAGYLTIQHWDALYSRWLGVPRSIKTTSVKPSGTVSLLAGATPGMHHPTYTTYIRRVRLAAASELVPQLRAAGYPVEPSATDSSSVVVEFPIRFKEAIRSEAEVSMWEQLALAAFLQRYWADNQVSCTVSFDPAVEGPQIKHALTFYQYQLKGVSFLPRHPAGAYKQMPYEAISEAEYLQRAGALQALRFGTLHEKAEQERFCDGATCTLA